MQRIFGEYHLVSRGGQLLISVHPDHVTVPSEGHRLRCFVEVMGSDELMPAILWVSINRHRQVVMWVMYREETASYAVNPELARTLAGRLHDDVLSNPEAHTEIPFLIGQFTAYVSRAVGIELYHRLYYGAQEAIAREPT